MSETEHPRKHLHTEAEIAWAVAHPRGKRAPKPRHAGNGLRSNGTYFLVVSVLALIGFMVAIVAVSARLM